jgi:riboflavin kinase
MAETQRDVDGDELATLKGLALVGALDGEEKVSCAMVGDRLSVSTQTASRRLQSLDEAGYLAREIVTDGQWVQVTDDGRERLREEYADYRHIFERDAGVTLAGTVTSGMGEGRHYITLSGYMRQFREKLGYEPFAGTLNIDLTEKSIRARSRLNALDPITIEGWEDDERTYGPAYCYPATVVSPDSYEQVHVITPERTHHGDDHLELIAPEKLRDVLDLADGTEVTVDVEKR